VAAAALEELVAQVVHQRRAAQAQRLVGARVHRALGQRAQQQRRGVAVAAARGGVVR
jgi:hypothetical protein